MSFRIVHAEGSRAIAAGSKGVRILDARTGKVLAEAPGAHSDVALAGGVPYGLFVKPGNPATISLRSYTSDLRGATTRPSPNPPYGGRVASRGERLYWQAGNIVEILQGGEFQRRIDVGILGRDVAALEDGFVVAADNEIVAYGFSGQLLWQAETETKTRFLVASDDYVVAWGSLSRDRDGQLVLPITILDASTGAPVAAIAQAGPHFAACAALDGRYLYVGRPHYRLHGPTEGAIEVFDLGDRGAHHRTVSVDFPPLSIAMTDFGLIGVSNDDVIGVPVEDLRPAAITDQTDLHGAQVDPYMQFLSTNELSADEAGLFQMLTAIRPLSSVAAYAAILAVLRG